MNTKPMDVRTSAGRRAKPGRILLVAVSLISVTILIVALFAPPIVERLFNKVTLPPPYQVGPQAQTLHRQLDVVDLHADSLLWKRDLLVKSSYGHADIPRLLEGNVALQVFAAVTKSPLGPSMQRNTADNDAVTLLAVGELWPPRTWGSLLQRALHQAEILERFAAQSQGRLLVVRNRRDLEEVLTRRKTNRAIVGGLLAFEGAHALDGNIANLDVLYDAGFRIVGLTHFFDNDVAGSAHGVEKGGLTPLGRQVVQRAQAKRMVIDLAHSSPQTIDDVLQMTTAPVIVSHTGLRGVCDSPRNLSDDQARRIAATGGVMGITMFEAAVCGKTIDDTARTIRYGVDLVGIDHMAVGSDFDGTTTAPFDASGMALLTEALLKQGFSAPEIAQIMGGNALRVLREGLPQE